jgi:histidinol-phosphate aminotransferase
MTAELRKLGFGVLQSQASFVWATRTDRAVKPIFEELKHRKILVRYMNYPSYGDGLRISVGSETDIDRLLDDLKRM